jgi:polar amino acid transport system permease protein
MIRRIVPPLGNYLISIFKETPLLSAISIFELMAEAKVVGSEYYRFMEPVTLVGVFFLVMSLSSAWFVNLVEYRLRLND